MSNVENIVNMSLIKLARDFPEAAKKIREEKYFITTVRDEKYNDFLMVDFTRRIDYNNEQDFMNYSSWLVSQFGQAKSWYNV